MGATSASFTAVVIDRNGRLHTHAIEAHDREHALREAAAKGQVVECNPRRATRSSRKRIDALKFAQDLATLVEAGVTVRESLAAMSRRESAAHARDLLRTVADSTSRGLSLSAALDRTGAFPELLVATVAASEQTGDLATGLFRFARHQQALRNVRDRVIGASVYPLLLMAVGSLVVVILLGIVVPRFSRLLDANGRELPFLSQMLLEWGRFADAHPFVPAALLAATIAFALFVIAQLRGDESRKRWAQRIPGVDRLARDFQHLQLYRTTAILTQGGIPPHRALALASPLLGPADRERLDVALARIGEGTPISTALAQTGLADAVASSMLAVAESSGSLPEMADRIADSHERVLQRNMEVATRLIEPVLMIVFGILVGGIVVLMYLPIFDLAASVS